MPFSIRDAEGSDSPAAVAVVRAVYDEYGFTWDAEAYHADLYDLDAAYLGKGHRFFVAESEGAVVGTAALELFPPLPGELGVPAPVDDYVRIGGCDAALNRLYVHPDARRGGIGRGLMAAVLEAARARDRRAMEIWSDKRFGPAHALYRAFGASQVAERICRDPDVSPEWGLWIRL